MLLFALKGMKTHTNRPWAAHEGQSEHSGFLGEPERPGETVFFL